jgi:hypothetical protein
LREARQTQEGEDGRLAVLIGGPLRVGTFQGVHIDFRHSDLPQGEWEALPWWHVWGPTPKWAGIIFPAEASGGLKKLRAAKGWGDALPAVYARPGDRITITAVTTEKMRSRFDHPHDQEVRIATLRIERPTGEFVEAGPLAFYGTGAIVGHSTVEAFDHMVERILGHAGFSDFPSPSERLVAGEYWGLSLEHAALKFAQSAHRDFFKLLDTMPPDEAGTDRAVLRSLANDAMLAGFLLAKIEGVEATQRAEKQVVGAQLTAAGRTSPRLVALAQNMASEHPDWGRTRLARELEDSWERDRRSIHATLKRLGIGPEAKRKQGGD